MKNSDRTWSVIYSLVHADLTIPNRMHSSTQYAEISCHCLVIKTNRLVVRTAVQCSISLDFTIRALLLLTSLHSRFQLCTNWCAEWAVFTYFIGIEPVSLVVQIIMRPIIHVGQYFITYSIYLYKQKFCRVHKENK